MKIKKFFAAIAAAAVMAAAVPMTGVLPDPLSRTAGAVIYDEDGLYIENGILRSVSVDVEYLTVPDGVTRIAAGALSRCKMLNYISIPASVTAISASFSACTLLDDIYVDPDNKKYASYDGILFNYDGTELIYYPMGRTNDIYCVPSYVEKIMSGAFSGCKYLTEIDIEDGVKSVNGFADCVNLKKVTIPASVTAISSTAFSGCTSLENIEVNSDNLKYCSVDGVLYNYDQTKLVRCPIGIDATSYTVPNDVTEISSYAFDGCYNLEKVFIPGSVKFIGYCAFSGCLKLKNLTISEGVAEIGNDAFSDCTALTNVNIPSSVNIIGSRAFSGCSRLSSLNFPDGIAEIGDNAFSNCKSFTSATITGDPKFGEAVFDKNFVLYGNKGSSVEKYVQDNRESLNYKFSALASTLKGDVNDDGIINIDDVTDILSHALGFTKLPNGMVDNADMNDDGVIDIDDVVLALETSLGL